MIIKEMPTEARPREKLLSSGPESLSDGELLALLINTGTREKTSLRLADELISCNGQGLGFFSTCTPEELMKLNGVGEAKACRIIAAVELGRRISASRARRDKRISTPGDAADMVMERVRHQTREHFFAVLLNTRGLLISIENISIGDLNSSMANPREAFTAAIRRSAAAVIFIHNHPGGDPTPSNGDINVTERLAEAGKLLGIPVLDHIVIGDGRYVSMKEKELL